MRSQAIWAVLLGASPALAAFEQFFFTGNGGNATAPRRCGDMIYECKEPAMCSRDTLTNKWYCCEPGNKVGPCWTGATKCEGSSADKPSAQQTGCTNLGVDYCCHEAEQCTQNAKQFRICWSKQPNSIRFLNSTRLNDTFSSLSAASPSATTYAMDAQQLFALTSTVPGASTSTPTPTPTSNPSPFLSAIASPSTPPSTAQPPRSSSTLSGRAIGGIAGGILAGLFVLALIAFLLYRRRKHAAPKQNPYDAPSNPYQGYAYTPTQPGAGYAAPQVVHEAHTSFAPHADAAHMLPADKYALASGPVEVPAQGPPAEMDGGFAGRVGVRK